MIKNLTFEELINLEDITQRIKDRANFYCEVVGKKAEQLSNSIPYIDNYEIESTIKVSSNSCTEHEFNGIYVNDSLGYEFTLDTTSTDKDYISFKEFDSTWEYAEDEEGFESDWDSPNYESYDVVEEILNLELDIFTLPKEELISYINEQILDTGRIEKKDIKIAKSILSSSVYFSKDKDSLEIPYKNGMFSLFEEDANLPLVTEEEIEFFRDAWKFINKRKEDVSSYTLEKWNTLERAFETSPNIWDRRFNESADDSRIRIGDFDYKKDKCFYHWHSIQKTLGEQNEYSIGKYSPKDKGFILTKVSCYPDYDIISMGYNFLRLSEELFLTEDYISLIDTRFDEIYETYKDEPFALEDNDWY